VALQDCFCHKATRKFLQTLNFPEYIHVKTGARKREDNGVRAGLTIRQTGQMPGVSRFWGPPA